MTERRIAVRRLDFWIRVVVAVQCFGLGGRFLFAAFETESDIYGWLYFDSAWPENVAQSIDDVGSVVTLVAGILLLFLGVVSRLTRREKWVRGQRWLNHIAACWIALWVIAISLAHMARAAAYPELALAEHAVRYAAPLSLLFFYPSGNRDDTISESGSRFASAGVWLLLIAAAATFAAHGYKACEHYGPFVDLLLLSDAQWTQWAIDQASANRLLTWIGVADIVAAALLVAFRWRFAALYMAVWGFVTAASRMTALGFEAWPETVLRIANGGVPLALFVYLAAIAANRPRKPSHADPQT